MSAQAFTLTGFERVADIEYAQSWLVTDQSKDATVCYTGRDA